MDLESRLAALREPDTRHTDDATVAGDLRRCRAAGANRRRQRRGVVAGAAVFSLAAAGALAYAATDDGNSPAPRAAAPTSVTPRSTSVAPRTPPADTGLRLVAYNGKQLPGYTVKRIPEGYVLQGISSSVLVVAERGDHTELDNFQGKLVFMLGEFTAPGTGQPVTVSGKPAHVRTDSGIRTLEYRYGDYNVQLQAWSNIKISVPQLVRFAEGVKILPGVQVGKG